MTLSPHLEAFSKTLSGELYYDDLLKSIYATDASVYRMLPLAVAYPKNKDDIINKNELLAYFRIEYLFKTLWFVFWSQYIYLK